ncbi:unnamed protein product [Rotaria magnacalcarata]|uniref:Uncharacterized protein n=1 Tax=Rotaria magnacalcarata TaxID=392030 RepID=A0A815N658_9BILA|nr:unnamed protein product [Rotaria magnacalcarata]CAF1677225.1 unnamed protein product [Rotaria magnacalcarata]CAF2045592.1 unnamed protein product [Rotaria magnacalcarata]CAF2055310.1 unnamed protein product [Rotaria magnacalcarata]CAF2123198.1 unnamed protein product [Rotaria magnacalcarata]
MVVSIYCISLIILIHVTWLIDLSCSLMRTQHEHQEDIALARGTALAGYPDDTARLWSTEPSESSNQYIDYQKSATYLSFEK